MLKGFSKFKGGGGGGGGLQFHPSQYYDYSKAYNQ